MKERVGKVEFTIFDYLVQIVVTKNIVKSRNNRSHLLGSTYHEQGKTVGLHSCNDDRANAYLFLTPNTTADIVAHECYHAISRMFKWIDAKHEEEITAYYLGDLVGEVTKFLNEKEPKKCK